MPLRTPPLLALFAAFAALWCAPRAEATYSIAGVDIESGEVGAAGASCVGTAVVVADIYGAAPGFGVVLAQASINRAGRDRAVELLLQGTTAQQVMSQITSASFDWRAPTRQYAVIDLQGNAAGYTGTSAMDYAEDRQIRFGDFVYSVQGNILTSAAVIDHAAAAFEAGGCDLADRLMRALEAGATNGEGDSRCTPDGKPADGAFLQVDPSGSEVGSYLRLTVNASQENPLIALRTQYDAWRATHPCPGAQPMMDAGIADAGMPDAGLPVADASSIDAAASGAGTTASGSGGASAGAGGASGTAGSSAGSGGDYAGAGASAGRNGGAGGQARGTAALGTGCGVSPAGQQRGFGVVVFACMAAVIARVMRGSRRRAR